VTTLNQLTDRFWRGRVTVYRCYDAETRLLYVGRSEDLPTRIKDHRRSSAWWPQVVRTVIKVFGNRLTASSAELAAIRNERPLHNVRYGPGWVEPGCRAAPTGSP
jgi:predicted GIY-YIG superfamily endonuclease